MVFIKECGIAIEGEKVKELKLNETTNFKREVNFFSLIKTF
jgi:hypothetical protein